ncbi:mucus-binding protein, partial [Lactobacillus acidophilus]|nr:mucus-binding protein [Lactobacillus acidophilus]
MIGQTDQNIVITYSANIQQVKILYVDEKGSEVSSMLLKGNTDQTVNVSYSVPDHWIAI